MKKYLSEYRAYIKSILEENNSETDYAELLEYHKSQILFFQHERLIHLIVTALISVLLILSILAIIAVKAPEIIPLALLLLALIIPYVKHYYFLENQVQALYYDYNKLYKMAYGYNYKDSKQVHRK